MVAPKKEDVPTYNFNGWALDMNPVTRPELWGVWPTAPWVPSAENPRPPAYAVFAIDRIKAGVTIVVDFGVRDESRTRCRAVTADVFEVTGEKRLHIAALTYTHVIAAPGLNDRFLSLTSGSKPLQVQYLGEIITQLSDEWCGSDKWKGAHLHQRADPTNETPRHFVWRNRDTNSTDLGIDKITWRSAPASGGCVHISQWLWKIASSEPEETATDAPTSTCPNLLKTIVIGARGTVSPAGVTAHRSGKSVTLTASPAAGYAFEQWTGDVPSGVTRTDSSISVKMDQDRAITGVFSPVPPTGLSLAADTGNANRLNLAFTANSSATRTELEIYRSAEATECRSIPSPGCDPADTAGGSLTSPVAFDNLTQGKWYRARGRSCVGADRVCGAWSAPTSAVYLAAAQPPVDLIGIGKIAGDNVVNAAEKKQPVTVSGTIASAGSTTAAATTVKVKVGDGTPQSATVTGNTWTYTIPANSADLKEGRVFIKVTGTRGGKALNPTSRAITVDTVAPTVSYTAPSTLQVGKAITTMTPTTAATDIKSYATTTLPPGLTLNATTGDIAGAPTTAKATTHTTTITVKDTAENSRNVSVTFPAVSAAPVPKPTVTIARVTSSVTEGGNAQYRLTRTGATTAALAVNVNVSGSRASSPGSRTVTIAAGSGSKTFSVATTDDTTLNPSSNVTATVQTGTGYAVGTPSSASVLVNDNDVPPPPTYYNIDADVHPTGAGTVSGTGSHQKGTTATLTASPVNPAQYVFSSWSGCTSSSGATCSVYVSGPKTVTATFTPPPQCTLTATPGTGGKVTQSASSVVCGQTITASAEADTCYTFTGWTGDVTSPASTILIKMDTPKNIRANFAHDGSTRTLTVKPSPTNAAESTTSTHTCGATVTPTHPTPKVCWNTSGTLSSVKMTRNRTVTASYVHNGIWYTLYTHVNPTGGGSVSGAGTYKCGENATLSASANNLWAFTHWSGNVSGTSSSIETTMTSSKWATANFSYLCNTNPNLPGCTSEDDEEAEGEGGEGEDEGAEP